MNPGSGARREANVRRVTQASLSARAKQLNRRRLDEPVFRAINQTGGGSRFECDPSKGIGMYLNFSIVGLGDIKLLARMEYQGIDLGGQPTYGITVIDGAFTATLNFDYGVGKWKFVLVGGVSTDVYYSDTLISANWDGTATPGAPAAGFTTCGYRELPVYCVDLSFFGSLVQPLPSWFASQDENTEVPPIWSGSLFSFLWSPSVGGPAGWIVSTSTASGGVGGGSIDELPIGEITLDDASTVTVSEGACGF